MPTRPLFKRTLLATALAPVTLGLPSLASAQQMEEVLITGSYIKSSASDAASPVDVLDNEFINRSRQRLYRVRDWTDEYRNSHRRQ